MADFIVRPIINSPLYASVAVFEVTLRVLVPAAHFRLVGLASTLVTRVSIDLGVMYRRKLFYPGLGRQGGGIGVHHLIFVLGLALDRVFRYRRKLTVAEQVLDSLTPEDVREFDKGESLTLTGRTRIGSSAVRRIAGFSFSLRHLDKRSAPTPFARSWFNLLGGLRKVSE
jgi:hypothetical protein